MIGPEAGPGGSILHADITGKITALGGPHLRADYQAPEIVTRKTGVFVGLAQIDRPPLFLGVKLRASQVRWVAGDVTAVDDLGPFDVWHDRAVFHFLTDPGDRRKYIALAERSVPVGGHLVIGTFALDGPEKCSGLPVEWYDGKKLAAELGNGFYLKKELAETHLTPWGKPQQLHFAVFERVNATVDADTLRQGLKEGKPVVVVDVRNDQDRAKSAIPGSIHFNASAALKANDPAAMAKLDVPADACVVTVCNAGHSATYAAKLLRNRGIDARPLENGMQGWPAKQP